MAMIMSSFLLSLVETFMLELGRFVALGNTMLQGPFLQITLSGDFLHLGKYVAQGRSKLQSSYSVTQPLSFFFSWSF